jgi:hypothetical protein
MTPRPKSLKEVSEHSDSLQAFGSNLRDWLHEVRELSSRPQLAASVKEEPAILEGRFPEGRIADAWLAAYAEHLSSGVGSPAPGWALDDSRIAPEPWFAPELTTPPLRALALAGSPLAFKRRNIYTPAVDLPVRLSPGRPKKSAGQKRISNAERQRRFRLRRAEELSKLRGLFSAHSQTSTPVT